MSPLRPAPKGPVVVFGATGLVGGHLVRILASMCDVEVHAPGRRTPPIRHPRVHFHSVDFDALDPERPPEWLSGCPTAFVSLGTTRRRAGSKEAFRRVDLTYVAAAAGSARSAGVRHLVAVSSVGASTNARTFYLQVKGEAEDALRELAFPSLTLARPSLLLGDRSERRPAETFAGVVLKPLSPLLRGPLAPLEPIAATTVARALVAAATDPPRGVQILEPGHLREMGADPA